MKKNNLSILTEAEEQTLLVQYLELRKFKFSAIAQSTWTRSWSQKMKNKRVGVRPGLPDLMVIIPYEKNGFKEQRICFIEMKRKGSGVLRQEQREWLIALEKVAGVWAFCCYGFEEAKAAVEKVEKEERIKTMSLIYAEIKE